MKCHQKGGGLIKVKGTSKSYPCGLDPKNNNAEMTQYATVAETCIVQLYDRVRYINSSASERLDLSVNEKLQLRVSWNAWNKGDTASRGFESFVKMFQDKPETQQVFSFAKGSSVEQMQSSSKLLFHVTRVFKYINMVIENLDKLENVVPLLRAAGGRHGCSGYNVPKDYFPHLGIAMRSLMKKELSNYTPSNDRLWERLYGFIVVQLCTGIDEYGA
ncbi:unnamed protein product [Owenia fusiformis]|uniref:Globin domain-containing protein n=1 Tax=Owenia fusiformis TaxID=6347 RepID=A0A8J1XS80_OWEFU|nr:unnamed protein product [Owenia fusiformis]